MIDHEYVAYGRGVPRLSVYSYDTSTAGTTYPTMMARREAWWSMWVEECRRIRTIATIELLMYIIS